MGLLRSRRLGVTVWGISVCLWGAVPLPVRLYERFDDASPRCYLRKAERSPGGSERLSCEARAGLLLLDPLLRISLSPLQASLPPGLAFHFSAQSSPIPTGH